MGTKRSLNKCADCKNTWYPKGKDLSSRCPECKSTNVEYAGSGLLGKLGIGVAVLLALSIFSGKDKQSAQPTADNGMPVGQPSQFEGGTPVTSPFQNDAVEFTKGGPYPVEYRASEINSERQSAEPKEAASLSNSAQENSDAERIYSDSEITAMEDSKQYHGDDSIVRRRLGLPSRETGKLIP